MRQCIPLEDLDSEIEAQDARRPGRLQDSVVAPAAGAERRRFLRWPVFWMAGLDDGDCASKCLVLDFSPGGAKLQSPEGPPVGVPVALRFSDAVQLFGKVAWTRGGLLGIEFLDETRHCASLLEDKLAHRALAS